MKRLFDIFISLLGLVILSPVLLTFMYLVYRQDKHSPFYVAPRVGKNGVMFKMLKLRSMSVNADRNGVDSTSADDSRITPIGHKIRRYKLDEFTQLWNVLMGDMSVIGPRALVKEEVRHFSDKVPYFSLRHAIKPGITGWAQVNYRHGANVEDGIEKLQYDLYYIKNLSIILDLHIIVKTIRVMCFGKGAR